MTDEHAATLIIVGDEILRGQVQDANTIYLAKRLLSVGIRIRRIVVIPDEVDIIAKEVSEASRNYPVVFTSGGVGPTHDDVTYEGVAKGLGLSLKEDKTLLEHLVRVFPDKPESRRLAVVPSPCELIRVKSRDLKEDYFVVKAGGVHVLPGSPRYFRPAVEAILRLLSVGEPLHRASLEVALDEFELVRLLDEQASRWSGRVAIGSYPQAGRAAHTRITLEARDRELLERAKRDIAGMLPPGKLQRHAFDEERALAVQRSARELQHVRDAFAVFEECYEKYKADEIFLSFNGGKDCTVVLHLAASFSMLRKLDPPLCLYVTGDAFPEVDEFVREAESYYGFEMVRKEEPIRQALATLLEEKPKLKACLLGTRKGDPGAHSLEPFAPTDPGWPELMRVSPIIDWTYSQVWDYLLTHEVPYCALYDEGYTSLGARDTTTKNPLLRDPKNPSKYLPAYTLADDSTERQGRN